VEEQQGFDLGLLEEIRTDIEYQAPDMADYLMLSELARITHLKHGRIHYGIKRAKLRPLSGIKRGDRWFVHRLDALQWAAGVANDQQARWMKQAQRLGKMVHREQVRAGIVPPEQRKPRDPLTNAPAGILTYSYSEAARMLNLAAATLMVYLAPSQELAGKIQRYRSADGRTVLSASDVHTVAMERKQAEADKRARDAKKAEKDNVVSIRRGAA
jgi:hypothetical protein